MTVDSSLLNKPARLRYRGKHRWMPGFLKVATREKCNQYDMCENLVFGAIVAMASVCTAVLSLPTILLILLAAFILHFVAASLLRARIDEIVSEKALALEHEQETRSKLFSTLDQERRKSEQLKIDKAFLRFALEKIAKSDRKLQSYTKELYTAFLCYVSDTTTTTRSLSPDERDALHYNLYVYDTKQKLVMRVAVHESSQTVASTNVTPATFYRKLRKYYFMKCLRDTKQELFFLENNQQIQNAFFFKSKDSAVTSQFTQYLACAFEVKGYIRLLVEIISCNGVVICSDHCCFHKEVLLPCSATFKWIDQSCIPNEEGSYA